MWNIVGIVSSSPIHFHSENIGLILGELDLEECEILLNLFLAFYSTHRTAGPKNRKSWDGVATITPLKYRVCGVRIHWNKKDRMGKFGEIAIYFF